MWDKIKTFFKPTHTHTHFSRSCNFPDFFSHIFFLKINYFFFFGNFIHKKATTQTNSPSQEIKLFLKKNEKQQTTLFY